MALVLCTPAVAQLDLEPISTDEWSVGQAAHLMSRAGFGGTPDQVAALASLAPANAVRLMVEGGRSRADLERFVHSGIFDEGLDPFPPSRPATTELAKRQGHALGVSVKPGGNRPLQPVVNRFFYWLRASRLETDRVAYWWADRMLRSPQPLVEKMALFWHGHFATNEDKVRDYRKMLQQLELFQDRGLGNFRDLLIGVAQDPAMLVFLDAGVNTKDSPNENFAREIMELFTMGVGHYSEEDVREAARAFTGWNVSNLDFTINEADHDPGTKAFLGHTGAFDGIAVIDIILEQPATSRFIASKIYRYFVSDDLSEPEAEQLGELLAELEYDIGAYLETLFLSRDFHSPENVGTRIKGPVELLISTYRRLDLEEVPGVPDFNVVSGALGQRLMHPPTVAGWSEGRSWITPSLMFERANFVLEVMFPDIGFVPPDRNPPFIAEVVRVQDRLRQGMSVAQATKPTGVQGGEDAMAASNLLADRDEEFNTRLGSMRGWQMAMERVLPIPRKPARMQLTALVTARELTNTQQVVDYFAEVFFNVPLSTETRESLAVYLAAELGTDDLESARSYMEAPLRKLLHEMLSLPEYQLG